MTCSDLQRALPDVLEDAPGIALPSEVENHVRTCSDCSDLVSDLKLISSQARNLSESDDPAPRVWVRIAAELRAEGLIHDSEPLQSRPHLVPAVPRRRFNSWWLAPVAAALLVAGSYLVSHNPVSRTPVPQVAQQQVPAPQVPEVQGPVVTANNPANPAPPKAIVPAQEAALKGKPADTAPSESARTVARTVEVEPAPSAEDQQFLTEVSTRAPSMRANYENQLQALNADIRETQEYVNRNPGDADARQHLMEAYEQKELLYQMALDRIQ